MKLPVPGPRDLLGVLERGSDQVEALLGVVPRVVGLLDEAEALLGLGPRLLGLLEGAELQLRRVTVIVDDVAVVTAAAAVEVAQVEDVVEQARRTVERTGAVVSRAEMLVDRLVPLLDGLEPPLTALRPTLEVLAETTDPDEVAALVRMVDHLPELTRRLETDVLPLVDTLGSVAPDLRDLLTVSRELNEIIGKVPGFGRIKKRVEEEQEDEDGDRDDA